MNTQRILFISIVLACAIATQAQDSRNPVPSADAQSKALALVREVYKDQYDKAKTGAEKEKLANELVQRAGAAVDVTNKYALLRVARDLSIQGSGPTAFLAVDAMAESFQIDGLDMNCKVLAKYGATAKNSTQNKAVAEKALELIDRALAADNFAAAAQLADVALTAAKKARNNALLKQVATLSDEVQKAAAAHAKMKAALAVLDAKPADPAANLAVGRYYCFRKGDWGKGLSMLALGSDPALKELAIKELRGVSEVTGQVALGDGWWDLAQTAEEAARKQLLARAGYWYTEAAPKLSGLLKSKVDKRLANIGEIGRPAFSTSRPATVPAMKKELSIDLGNGAKMEFVLIPAGEFMMGEAAGQDHANPVHKVAITKPFYLGKYEVTQAQWQPVMGNNPSQFKGPTNPVEKVSWNDIQQFLAKLNMAFEKKGMVFGLPTEAGWEYACRAGTTTAFYFGDNPALLAQHGWSKDNSGGKPHPVGQLKPNAWGLYDMYGNMWEWCSDWHAKDFYAQSPAVDPVGPPTGSGRVHRGGAWIASPENCRSAHRHGSSPGRRTYFLGFRLALVLTGKAAP